MFLLLRCMWDVLAGSQVAEAVARSVTQTIEDYKLQGRVSAVVTDGATNMIAACRDYLHIERVQCGAHALQLAVRAGLAQDVRAMSFVLPDWSLGRRRSRR